MNGILLQVLLTKHTSTDMFSKNNLLQVLHGHGGACNELAECSVFAELNLASLHI